MPSLRVITLYNARFLQFGHLEARPFASTALRANLHPTNPHVAHVAIPISGVSIRLSQSGQRDGSLAMGTSFAPCATA